MGLADEQKLFQNALDIPLPGGDLEDPGDEEEEVAPEPVDHDSDPEDIEYGDGGDVVPPAEQKKSPSFDHFFTFWTFFALFFRLSLFFFIGFFFVG